MLGILEVNEIVTEKQFEVSPIEKQGWKEEIGKTRVMYFFFWGGGAQTFLTQDLSTQPPSRLASNSQCWDFKQVTPCPATLFFSTKFNNLFKEKYHQYHLQTQF
jgi:hypothetical protein